MLFLWSIVVKTIEDFGQFDIRGTKNSPASRGKISVNRPLLKQTVLVESDHYLEKIGFTANVAIDISKLDGFFALKITRTSQVFCPGLRYWLPASSLRYRLRYFLGPLFGRP